MECSSVHIISPQVIALPFYADEYLLTTNEPYERISTKVKHKQPYPGFELGSLIPFSTNDCYARMSCFMVSHILNTNWTLRGTTTLGQSWPGSNDNEEVLYTFQSPRTGPSPLDAVWYHTCRSHCSNVQNKQQELQHLLLQQLQLVSSWQTKNKIGGNSIPSPLFSKIVRNMQC